MLAALTLTLALVTPAASATNEAEAYLNNVERRIMAAWRLPPRVEGLKVSLRFTLAHTGRISKLRVEKSSGNAHFDITAVQAVQRASPFPRPPKSFPVGDLRIVLEPTMMDRRFQNTEDDGETI